MTKAPALKATRKARADAGLDCLAVRVVSLRRNAGLTQEESAHRAGVSLRTYQNLEKGRLNPSYLTLRKISKGLGATLAELVQD